jgi:nucleoside-diphosphate-sugar epimerase
VLKEDMHGKPDTLYGEIKLQAERSLAALCGHGFVTASLRATGIYGSAGHGQRHKWAELFEDYLAGKPVSPRSSTEVHGDDVARAVRLMLESDTVRINGEVFNVSDLLTDTNNILSILQQSTHCPHPLPAASDIAGINPMGTCKIEALGWKPGGMELLKETIERLAQPAGPE